MDFLDFSNISYTYPSVEGDLDEEGNKVVSVPVYKGFSAKIPCDFISITGPNAAGKSTLMLLGAARVLPQSGEVKLLGYNSATLSDTQKSLLASFLYQNMEFMESANIGTLLTNVYSSGLYAKGYEDIAQRQYSGDLLQESIKAFKLEGLLEHTLSTISKGELQRVLLAFSILYGSLSVFMDEPFFAMEPQHTEAALEFLKDYALRTKTAFIISMHELDLSYRYANKVLLLHPDHSIDFGTPQEVLTKEHLELAYNFPEGMLRAHEDLTRKKLLSISQAIKDAR